MEPPAPLAVTLSPPEPIETNARGRAAIEMLVAEADPQLQLTPDELELLLETTTSDEPDDAVPPSPFTSGDDASSERGSDPPSMMDPKRARRSEIEKLSRRRRQSTLREMRDEVRQLERKTNAMLVGEREARDKRPSNEETTPAIADQPGDLEAVREQFIKLSIEAQRLEAEKNDLRHMLRSRQLLTQSIGSLAATFADNWEESSWKNSLVRTYQPLPPEEQFRVMRQSFESITQYDARTDVVSSGKAFMGWADRRHIDDSGMFFSFTKRFPGRDPEQVMLDSWAIFTQEELLKKTLMLNSQADLRLRVLQEPNDDVMVLHRQTKFLHLNKAFHTVYLLFRIRTDDGFTICFRTVPAPGIQESLEELDTWLDLFHWIHFKYIRDDATGDSLGCDVIFGGAICGRFFDTVERFLIGSFASVTRWENATIAPLFLVSPSEP